MGHTGTILRRKNFQFLAIRLGYMAQPCSIGGKFGEIDVAGVGNSSRKHSPVLAQQHRIARRGEVLEVVAQGYIVVGIEYPKGAH